MGSLMFLFAYTLGFPASQPGFEVTECSQLFWIHFGAHKLEVLNSTWEFPEVFKKEPHPLIIHQSARA